MEIRLFGCKIYISLLFIAMICLILFFDSTGIILFGLCSVLIHEIGHILFMAVLKQMPDEIIMQPAGIIIKRKNLIMKYSDELLVATGGCLFNLIFGVSFISLYYINYNILWMIFAAANLSIAFFNLMPVSGLDGGDILRFFLYRIMPESKANMICKIISIFMAVCVIIFSVYVIIFSNASIGVLLAGVYIIILVIINLRS